MNLLVTFLPSGRKIRGDAIEVVHHMHVGAVLSPAHGIGEFVEWLAHELGFVAEPDPVDALDSRCRWLLAELERHGLVEVVERPTRADRAERTVAIVGPPIRLAPFTEVKGS